MALPFGSKKSVERIAVVNQNRLYLAFANLAPEHVAPEHVPVPFQRFARQQTERIVSGEPIGSEDLCWRRDLTENLLVLLFDSSFLRNGFYNKGLELVRELPNLLFAG